MCKTEMVALRFLVWKNKIICSILLKRQSGSKISHSDIKVKVKVFLFAADKYCEEDIKSNDFISVIERRS